MKKDIFELSQQLTDSYESPVYIAEGLPFSLKDTRKRIEYITNSKYLSGDHDEFGREKPYYNITNYRLNVAVRATDFDTKDFTITSETRDYTRSLLARKKMHQWMKSKVFSKTLNEVGKHTPKNGFTLVKKLVLGKKGEDVDVQVVKQSNAIINQISPLDHPIKELHPSITRAEVAMKRGVWDDQAIDTLLSTDQETFEVCEITGVMPVCVFDGSDNTYEYKLYKFIIHEGVKEEENAILFKAELDGKITDYYRIAEWDPQENRVPRGVVEDMFEAQTGTNETKLLERDAMIMASKTVFATDSDIIENNIITDMDMGQVIKIDEGSSLTQVNTMTNALPAFDRLKQDWDDQAEKVTSTFDSLTGETLPSGTPFRSVAIQNQEASSLFIYRREAQGIFWQGIFNDWIIPVIVDEINKEWILSAEFTAEELAKIDEDFGIYKSNEIIKKKLLNLEVDKDLTPQKYEEMINAYKALAQETGNVRYLEVPKDYFKDFKFKSSVITTNEQRNKAVMLESMSNILSQVAGTFNPQTGSFALLENPVLSSIFSRIVEVSGAGVSPATISQIQNGASSASSIKLPSTPESEAAPEVVEQTATAADQA